MTEYPNQSSETTIKGLLRGNLADWHGLPEDTSFNDVAALYEESPAGRSGRLSGHWATYHNFSATSTQPHIRVWSREGQVLRIDLEKPGFENETKTLDRLGKPSRQRLPPTGYRYDDEDELIEYLYPTRGLVLHVSDPTLPGGSPTRRIVRVRAFTPMPIEDYDRNLGGQQPGRIRRPGKRPPHH